MPMIARFRLARAAAMAVVATFAAPATAQHAEHTPMAAAKPTAAKELGTSAAFAPDGKLWIARKEGQFVVVQSSDDDGRSWSGARLVNGQPEAISADGENRPKIAFTPAGEALVSWTKPLAKPYTGEIRLARSGDGGATFTPPITVHQDRSEITHRFESLLVGADGRITVAWIDKRDLEANKGKKDAYRGAAIYSAVSTDGGRNFAAEKKVADHSCECCRIAAALDRDGTPLLLWRHVFAPNERDHALARLKPDGSAKSVQRATFDHWQVDACPHHGPSLAVDARGTRHAVWFNQKGGEGRVFYGRLVPAGDAIQVQGQRAVGGPRAAHADLATAGSRVAIVWKEFDGERTVLQAMLSGDGGDSFQTATLAATDGASDQPRVLRRGDALFAFWRTDKEGFRLVPLP